MKKNLLIIFLLTAVFNFLSAQVAVTLPELTVSVAPGTIIEVPVNIGSVSGLNVVAYQFTLIFDESVLKPEHPFVNTSATLSGLAGMSVMANANFQNKLMIGAFGANPLEGSGTLVRLIFKVIAAQGSSPLTFNPFVFNAGTPQATITQGSLTNQFGATPLTISLPQLALNQAPGTIIEVPLTAGNLSGLNIFAYQFSVGFDNAILTPEPPYFSTSGTLSSNMGWSIMANPNNDNRLIIGAFGSEPLSGSGVLLKLIFKIIPASGSCPLTFNSFMFNAGTPQVNLVNGSFSNQYSTLPPPELVLQNVTLLAGESIIFEALGTISVSDFTIQNGASALFISGGEIIFGSGTKVLAGGQMHARIEARKSYCNKPETQPVETQKSKDKLIINDDLQLLPARFRAFPNPVSSTLTIEATAFVEDQYFTEVYDMLGARIFDGKFPGSQKLEIDFSGRPDGLYLIRIINGKHNEVHKVLKR